MKKLLLILLVATAVYPQVVLNETFSSFMPDSTITTGGYWWFDPSNTTVTVDFSQDAENHVLTAAGSVGDSVFADSPLKVGGQSIYFNGTTQRYTIAAGNTTSLRPRTDDFTVILYFREPAGASTTLAHVAQGEFVTGRWTIGPGSYAGGSANLTASDGTNRQSLFATYANVSDNWHVYAFMRRAAEDKFVTYFDGDSVASVSHTASYDFNANGEFKIGSVSTFFSQGYFALVKIIKGVDYTARQLREDIYLADGWLSQNGKVLRENYAFYQTFHDTIGIPLSDAALGNKQVWQLSYKGKSSDATKTIKAWIGSVASAKSSVYTVTAGTAFATNTVNFGDGFALSSDTLWFASASTADTVSVDDVVLSKARNITEKGSFKGWLGY